MYKNDEKLKIAFVTEEFSAIEPSWDNSILFAREFVRRGHDVRFAPKTTLRLSTDGVTARLFSNRFEADRDPRPDFVNAGGMNLRDFDLVMLRIDPPVDATYLAVTYMLDYAGTLVLNRPAAIRQYNEKIAIFSYPEGIVETAVVLSIEEGLAFVRSHPEIRRWIAKPTNAFGGLGVSAFIADDEPGARSAMAKAAGERREPIMLQRFNERIVDGDKRIFLVEGRPVGWVNRVPKKGDYLANIHAGAVTLPYELDDADRAACAHVARMYPADDLPLICIDVIGDRLSEVNVTCPSGMIQINRAMNRRCETEVVDCLERRARAAR
jgi:glutathione synthase